MSTLTFLEQNVLLVDIKLTMRVYIFLLLQYLKSEEPAAAHAYNGFHACRGSDYLKLV